MTRGVVPSFDPSAERWGLNRLMFTRYAGECDVWDRWFDLHSAEHIQRERSDAWAWYARQSDQRPIYGWSLDPRIPGHAAYPRGPVQAFFDGDRDFAGSLSWMLALAIYERFDAIDLFWFTMDVGHEWQIPSARYWIGQARGRGIAVTVHGDSGLVPSGPLYGCETGDGVPVVGL